MKSMEFFRLKVTRECKLIDAVSSCGFSRKRAKKIIDEGLVSVNGVKETFYRKNLRIGSLVEFCFNPFLFAVEFKVLFKKEGVYVVEKPPFLNSNRDRPNLEELALRKLKKRLTVVHRLDKQTSGAIIAVDRMELFEYFKEAFKKGLVEKEYLALVYGIPKRKKFRIDVPLDGKRALTEVEVLEELKGGALCKVAIPTGRTHQIRRHLSYLGYPVVGEFKYWKRYQFPYTLSPRILLHSHKVSFPLPLSRERVSVESPLFKDFKEFLDLIREAGFPPTSQGI